MRATPWIPRERESPMMRSIRAAALGGLAVGLLGTAHAGPGAKPTVEWAKSWNEAVEEATARNVPIFVSFHKDG